MIHDKPKAVNKAQYDSAQMRRQFTDISMFDLQKIIVPVNLQNNTHWGMLLVDFRLHPQHEKQVANQFIMFTYQTDHRDAVAYYRQ